MGVTVATDGACRGCDNRPMRGAFVIVGILVLAGGVARADRPDGLMASATPGFGYAWDRTDTCELGGRMFAGGFSVVGFVAPGLAVGGSAVIRFNLLPEDGPCMATEPSGGRLAIAMIVGPIVQWYPRAHGGLNLVASAGYASIEQIEQEQHTSHGVGGSLAIGYDWAAKARVNGSISRVGVMLHLAALRTTDRHGALSPALLATFSFD